MSVATSRQEIHKMLDSLPSEALPDLLDYLEYLRYRTSRPTADSAVEKAIQAYGMGEISLGRAAELAGMNYFSFEQVLRERGITSIAPQVSQTTDADLQQDLVDGLLA